jgi:hypothetical protein
MRSISTRGDPVYRSPWKPHQGRSGGAACLRSPDPCPSSLPLPDAAPNKLARRLWSPMEVASCRGARFWGLRQAGTDWTSTRRVAFFCSTGAYRARSTGTVTSDPGFLFFLSALLISVCAHSAAAGSGQFRRVGLSTFNNPSVVVFELPLSTCGLFKTSCPLFLDGRARPKPLGYL